GSFEFSSPSQKLPYQIFYLRSPFNGARNVHKRLSESISRQLAVLAGLRLRHHIIGTPGGVQVKQSDIVEIFALPLGRYGRGAKLQMRRQVGLAQYSLLVNLLETAAPVSPAATGAGHDRVMLHLLDAPFEVLPELAVAIAGVE